MRLFAPAVCDLREGDRLVQVAQEGAWFNATFKSKTGWVHQSDVTTKEGVRLSGEGVSERYSASESAAARKGFTPQVEQEYRQQKDVKLVSTSAPDGDPARATG